MSLVLPAMGFTGETSVQTEGGNKRRGSCTSAIEHISVGSRVLSRCEISGEIAYKRVTKVHRQDFAKISSISCAYGEEFSLAFGVVSHHILTSAESVIFVAERGWSRVSSLVAGDRLTTFNGEPATVQEVRMNFMREGLYNLEVEDFQTYFADLAGIWVLDGIARPVR